MTRTVVVTGAAGVIGKAVVQRLVADGDLVVAVDCDGPGLGALVEALGDRVWPHVADVTVADEVRGFAEAAAALGGGRIDAFFNNAGVEGPVRPIVDLDEAVFDHVLAINVKGVFLGLKHVLPHMGEGGSVVNTSSALGLVGAPDLAACAASKHAVIGLTKVAALESAAAGIRVNAVCPGPIDGRMMDSLNAGFFGSSGTTFASIVPMGRQGRPEEVAGLVRFLLSAESSYISGTSYSVDGAMVTP